MRTPARIKSARGQVVSTASIPAPVKGWNARDSLANMEPDYAPQLDNWFPSTSDIILRKGASNHLTAIPSTPQVDSLMVYRPMTGSHKMFAATANGNFYDASSAGAAGAAVQSSLTNGKWQHVNFSTIGGNYLYAVNGFDKPRLYDGAAWVAVDGASTPAITGVTTTSLININVFKERVWFVEKDSLSVWYLPIGAIGGAASEFDLSSIFKMGGYLVGMGTWTLDGGTGLDDYAVFITSQGEVAVYQGTNPGSAATWALVGIFVIGAPIGYKCFVKLAGDLAIITRDGVVPASKAFSQGRANARIALTDNINGAMSSAAELYNANYGWELTLFPSASMLILNVPVATGSQQQYVMNTITGAWCRFLEWDANCFAILNEELYFGTQGKVVKAWTGTADYGTNIVGEVVTAFNYFRGNKALKSFRLIRPMIAWDTNPSTFLIGTDVDFIVRPPTGEIVFPTSPGGIWDTGTWDNGLWGGDVSIKRVWYSTHGEGYAASAHMIVTSTLAQVRVVAFDFTFELGGIL